ncbi:MAG TPA: NAD(P)/FAD-dependent oxidoreductase [Xanthomonadaceae bacterium]|nr:NAD(P)/FAD-dependent oxidoreductase [Xanthomonadaceae bacterium]
MKHVVVLGGGFGGLWATRALARAPVRITLVDRVNHHLFQPLLYQVATAGLSGPDIAAPLRHILRRQRNVSVRLDEALDVYLAARRVRLRHGEIGYDYLVAATGSVTSYFGQAWQAQAPGLKTLGDALHIRRQILESFEAAEREEDAARRARWLRFVVIGGGPTGVELAGTLAEIANHTLPGEFRHADPRSAEILLLEGGTRVLPSMPESLSASARRQLERLGVRVRTDCMVTGIGQDVVELGDGERIHARTILWTAGVAASPLGARLCAQPAPGGRVPVAPDLSLPGHPEVFVVGDLAAVDMEDGRPVPGVAPAAKQMGNHAAEAIRARLAGRAAKPFRYRDYGNLATIGRRAAVVDLRGLHFTGVVAWVFWLTAHLYFLVGFRNRLVVLIDWARSYVTYQRSARIVAGAEDATRPD